MSDIRKGDLVMIVRACCDGYIDVGGPIFTVVGFSPAPGTTRCGACKSPLPDEPRAKATPDENGVPISWLRRIPPLDELERNQIVEELTAWM